MIKKIPDAGNDSNLLALAVLMTYCNYSVPINALKKKIPRRRITVRSSLNEISTDRLENT
jgi:hypothetical protein